MKHLLLVSLLTVALPLASSAGNSQKLSPEEIIAACSNKIESIQKMDEEYIKWTKGADNSSFFTKALSSTGVSSVALGAVFFSVSASNIVMLGPISVAAGLAGVVTANQMSAPDYEKEVLNLKIVFPTKEDAQSFLTERAYRIDGLQTGKFIAQCQQLAMGSGDTETNAKYYCNQMAKRMSYELETGKICKVDSAQ